MIWLGFFLGWVLTLKSIVLLGGSGGAVIVFTVVVLAGNCGVAVIGKDELVLGGMSGGDTDLPWCGSWVSTSMVVC